MYMYIIVLTKVYVQYICMYLYSSIYRCAVVLPEFSQDKGHILLTYASDKGQEAIVVQLLDAGADTKASIEAKTKEVDTRKHHSLHIYYVMLCYT